MLNKNSCNKKGRRKTVKKYEWGGGGGGGKSEEKTQQMTHAMDVQVTFACLFCPILELNYSDTAWPKRTVTLEMKCSLVNDSTTPETIRRFARLTSPPIKELSSPQKMAPCFLVFILFWWRSAFPFLFWRRSTLRRKFDSFLTDNGHR